jgi:signal transduction histidine kinase
MVQELSGQMQLTDPGRRVRLEIPPRVVVQGDPQLLRIALENLVSNAWKYSSEAAEPVIELGTFASEEGETVVYLRDNGAGFDDTRSEELFKPFKRLHSSREFPGTGLGLATVRRIIRRHNGRIWGEGKPGGGATFYFTVQG